MRFRHGHAGAFSVSLEEVVPFIDWTPFFHTWELRGVYPKFSSMKHGEEATKLLLMRKKLLAEFVANNRCNSAPLWFVPRKRCW